MASAAATSFIDPRHGAQIRPGGLQVLVVEDDAADAYLIKCALADDPRIGHVTRVTNGAEALERLDGEEIVPDIAIIDLHMPRMDGFKFLIQLRCRTRRGFPAVVLTSSTARKDLVRSHLRGADLVLTKPNSLRELEILLRTAIDTI